MPDGGAMALDIGGRGGEASGRRGDLLLPALIPVTRRERRKWGS